MLIELGSIEATGWERAALAYFLGRDGQAPPEQVAAAVRYLAGAWLDDLRQRYLQDCRTETREQDGSLAFPAFCNRPGPPRAGRD